MSGYIYNGLKSASREVRAAINPDAPVVLSEKALAERAEQRAVSGPERLAVVDFASQVADMQARGGYEAWVAAHDSAIISNGAANATLGYEEASRTAMMQYFYPRLQQSSIVRRGKLGEYEYSNQGFSFGPNLLQYQEFRTKKTLATTTESGGAFGGFFMPIRPEDLSNVAKSLQGGGQWFTAYLENGTYHWFNNRTGATLTTQQQAFVSAFDKVMVGLLNAKRQNPDIPRLQLEHFIAMRADETITGAEMAALIKAAGLTEDLKAMGPELATQWVALTGGVLQNIATYVQAPSQLREQTKVEEAIQKFRFTMDKFLGLYSPAARAELISLNQGSKADYDFRGSSVPLPLTSSFDETIRRAVGLLGDKDYFVKSFDNAFVPPAPRTVLPVLPDDDAKKIACQQ